MNESIAEQEQVIQKSKKESEKCIQEAKVAEQQITNVRTSQTITS